jgi:hypothetical protein
MKKLLTITTALIIFASCKKSTVSKPINRYNYTEELKTYNSATHIGLLVDFDFYMTGTYTLTAVVNGQPYVNTNTFQSGNSVFIPTNWTTNDSVYTVKLTITSPDYNVQN